jgi:N-acetylneuraminic acid mutarotase
MGRRNEGYGSLMTAGFASVSRVIGQVLAAMTLFAACTADPPSSSSWVQRASMEIARSEIPAAVIGETIYVPGGLVSTAQGVGVAASMEIYHTETDAWESAADLPVPRHHSMSVAVEGLVYLLGGFGDAFDPWATGWVYEPQPDGWGEIADLPLSVGAGAAAEIDGIIYVAGGVPLGTSLYAYDPNADTWETLASMIQPREHTAAVAFDGDLWVLGGRWDEAMLNSVEIFDTETGSWSSGPSMQEARSGFGATVLDDSIYVAGGEVFDQSEGFAATALDTVERFDGDSWTFAQPLPRQLHGVPLVTVGDTIYLLSGSIEAAAANNTGEVWSLQP